MELSKEVYKYTRSNVNETLELIYDFLCDYIRENGFAPAVRDICQGLDIRSTSTVHTHLKRLEESGRIVYASGKRRAITLPQEVLNRLRPQEPGPALEGAYGEDEGEISRMRTRYIPLIGTVTAGVPILAQEQIEYLLPFPADYFSDQDELFMLRVRGDSMVDAAILDGDLVLVKKKDHADFGKIVVARIDDEATVKRLIRHEGRPYLKPENEAYPLIPFYDASCAILGEVSQVLRSHVR